MEYLSDDLFIKILGFLSLKEKIMTREISLYFKYRINPILLSIYKLDNLFKITHSIETKRSSDLTCNVKYNNFTIYKMNSPSFQIHSLFSINNNYDRCMVNTCREKKLGYIYFSKRKVNTINIINSYQWNLYNKRNIPYCYNCFYNWTLYCSNDEKKSN